MKLNVVLLFTLLSSNVWAQYESIFGDETTSWNLFQELYDGFSTDSLFYEKDTIIDGIQYKKIWDKYYLRETTDYSKVYLYNPNISENEFLVLDLNMEVLDTFKIGVNQEIELIVDAIYYVNNKKHIRFDKIIEFAGGSENFEFIEGVGSNFGLFYQGVNLNTIISRNYLLCSYKNEIISYSNNAFNGSCNINWTKNDENKIKNKINYFLLNNILLIDYKGDIVNDVNIIIYNTNGKIVKNITTQILPIEIDLSNIPNGIYFMTFIINKHIINIKILNSK